MAKLGPIHAEITYGPVLRSVMETQSALLVDRDKWKILYESSENALIAVLEELTTSRHELDSIKGVVHV
jgi:hypothetical protein